MTDPDVRRFQRFQLQIVALFSWKSGGSRQKGQGVTRDISSNGIVVEADVVPPLNTPVQVSLQCAPAVPGRRALTISAKGRVIRRDLLPENEKPGKYSFAICFDSSMRVQKAAVQGKVEV
jgi:PilZ domain